MAPSIESIFIGLFFISFVVGVAAFSAYGYLLILLLKNHSEKFKPKGFFWYIRFQFMLLVYYASRAFSGFFGYERVAQNSFYHQKDLSVKEAEMETPRLTRVYNTFSTLYVIFFVLIVATFIAFLYMMGNMLI